MTSASRNNLTLKWLFFSFKGRIGRQSYILAQILIVAIQFLVIWQIAKAANNESLLALWGLAFIALGLVTLWSISALAVKRLNDLDLPAVLFLLLFVPGILWLFMLFLMIVPTKQVTNKHGPPPFTK